MKYTSQWNGVSPPVARLRNFPIFGMFCVSSVYRPGPNRSSACPFRKKIASCDSRTMSCVRLLKSSLGCFQMKVLLSPSYLMISAICPMEQSLLFRFAIVYFCKSTNYAEIFSEWN